MLQAHGGAKAVLASAGELDEAVFLSIVILAPEIRSAERTSNGVRLHLNIGNDLSYFEGHFEGCPLVPGVVQVGWAIELGRQYLGFDGCFRGMRAVKFMRVIVPETLVTLQLDYDATRRELDFAFDVGGRAISSGTVHFEA